MGTIPEDLEAQVMKLDLEARARLAEKLLLSLETPSEAENLRLWVAEAERRLHRMKEGKDSELPAEEVFRHLREAIR
ncbi:MAG: addiction module protein [Limnochordaceae bacterium]|nr:addiction module protein [Limnochordaceae bacterium]